MITIYGALIKSICMYLQFQGLVSELVQGTFVPLLIKHGRLAEDFTVRAGQKKVIFELRAHLLGHPALF